MRRRRATAAGRGRVFLPWLAALAIAPVLAFLARPSAAQPSEAVHRLAFPELRLQFVEVEAELPAAGPVTEVLLPTWTPGSYQRHAYDADVDGLRAFAPNEERLEVRKVARDAWRIDSAGLDTIVLRYRVHADDLDVSRSWVSPDWILLNGPTVFLYTAQSRALPQRLTVTPPPGLDRVMTPLAAAGQGSWRARDYDELVDSPVVVARDEPLGFEADGQQYYLVHVGGPGRWAGEEVLEDLGAVVRTVNDFWPGAPPFERPFWFFNVLAERSGGLEHDHGTVLMAGRWQMRDRAQYVHWLSLAAHEYFHAWNVRRLRPAELAAYDYRREQHTRSLWIAEGLTSYYDDLLLARAGVVEPGEYLERLALQLHALELRPGRLRQSLAEASFDAWTRQYQPDANALNADVSYYVKGAVVAFVLDQQIRERSRGRQTLDDVLERMWQRWAAEPYPESAFVEALEEMAGEGLAAWLEPLVEGTAEPDVDQALAWYGLRLERHPEKAALEAAGAAIGAGFGINWAEQGVALVAAAVVHGSGAAQAGVLPGDELVAIDGERVTRANLESLKDRLRPGETVEFLLARQGRMLTLPVTAGEARPRRYEIRTLDRVSERQINRLQGWLGQRLVRRY